MNTPDILGYIQAELTAPGEPLTPARVEQTIQNARYLYGGDTIYIRTLERQKVTRRTEQNRQARAR